MGLLFLAFTLLPLIELSLLIRIGRVVGAGPTLLFVIAMGVLGAVLAKRQGRKVLREWREAMAAGRVPEEGVLGGVLVLVGGLLLITPGVVTDVAGLFCLVPTTRRWIAHALQNYLARQVAQGQVQVHSYGFEWPPRPPRDPSEPATRSSARPSRPLREDVIDTDGEEIR